MSPQCRTGHGWPLALLDCKAVPGFCPPGFAASSVPGPRVLRSAGSRPCPARPLRVLENSTPPARFRRIPAGLGLRRSFLSPACFRGVSSRPLSRAWRRCPVPSTRGTRGPDRTSAGGCIWLQDCSPTECEVRSGNDVADSRHESGYCGIHFRIKFQRLASRDALLRFALCSGEFTAAWSGCAALPVACALRHPVRQPLCGHCVAVREVAHLPDELPRGTDTRGYAGD